MKRRRRQKRTLWRGILALLALFFLAGASVVMSLRHQLAISDDDVIATALPTAVARRSPTPTPTGSATPQVLPATYLLKMQFVSQAPFKKWDALHEDACEEASLYMVQHYLNDSDVGSLDAQDSWIIDLVHWEEQNNYGPSVTLQQLVTIAKERAGLSNGQVFAANSVDAIKREVFAGNPVILGMAGRILPNPNFTNGGPIYHMLVVKGWDETGFITNDPGTRKGEHFHYDYAAFMNAIHDWDASDIMKGAPRYLVFK
jgi:hypothetical protein